MPDKEEKSPRSQVYSIESFKWRPDSAMRKWLTSHKVMFVSSVTNNNNKNTEIK